MQNIFDLQCEDARSFLSLSDSYSTIELPSYFDFAPVLKRCDLATAGSKLSDHITKEQMGGDINHKILQNKDGEFAWRRLELINPFLYLDLVQNITVPEAWDELRNRFAEFADTPNVTCTSLPKITSDEKPSRALEISGWWNHFEQRTTEMSFNFGYVIHTDLTDCYGSIYTHAVAWALHGREFIKDNKSKEFLGNRIDDALRQMQWKESSGIPQGSVLMDVIAELVLGYLDTLYFQALPEYLHPEFHVLRHRDDFRIFATSESTANRVLQEISVQAESIGLRINATKTSGSNDIVGAAIKQDKLAWIQRVEQLQYDHFFHSLHDFSKSYPNSPRIKMALLNFNEQLDANPFETVRQPLQLIAIALEIGCRNPGSFAASISVISRLLEDLKPEAQVEVITMISKRIERVSNSSFLQIWLQRLVYPRGLLFKFNEALCSRVESAVAPIWSGDWIKTPSLKAVLLNTDIVNRNDSALVDPVVRSAEINLEYQYS